MNSGGSMPESASQGRGIVTATTRAAAAPNVRLGTKVWARAAAASAASQQKTQFMAADVRMYSPVRR